MQVSCQCFDLIRYSFPEQCGHASAVRPHRDLPKACVCLCVVCFSMDVKFSSVYEHVWYKNLCSGGLCVGADVAVWVFNLCLVLLSVCVCGFWFCVCVHVRARSGFS